ncbi:TSUP family transporter [Methylorubrum extorquens]
MTGTSGGTLTTPILSTCGLALEKAIAIASATGLVTGSIATIGGILSGWHAPDRPSYSLGYVDVVIFVVMMPTVMISAPWGVSVGEKFSETTLQRTYAALLILVGLDLLRRLAF